MLPLLHYVVAAILALALVLLTCAIYALALWLGGLPALATLGAGVLATIVLVGLWWAFWSAEGSY